jgi:DNA adenine methylase
VAEVSIAEDVMNEVARYVLENFKPPKNIKLIWYPGGDYFIFDDLNRVFMMAPPEAYTFVEVFGGSCWCSLNVSRSKFRIIVANDIDSTLITLYRLVRDSPEELIRRLSILPLSREIKEVAKEILADPKADHITKAVMLFYLTRASTFACGGFTISRRQRQFARSFSDAISAIKEFSKRFRDVVLENRDYREIIKRYDSEHTLFYLDPPYVSASETQAREGYFNYTFTLADLWAMAMALRNIKGYFVLKIAEDNYAFVRDSLPKHEALVVEKVAFQGTVEPGARKPTWRFIIAHNIKAPQRTSLRRWLK